MSKALTCVATGIVALLLVGLVLVVRSGPRALAPSPDASIANDGNRPAAQSFDAGTSHVPRDLGLARALAPDMHIVDTFDTDLARGSSDPVCEMKAWLRVCPSCH